MALSPTSRHPSSFPLISSNSSLVSNKKQTPRLRRIPLGVGERVVWPQEGPSRLISRSTLRGSWHLPQSSRQPSDHRLPQLHRARPSTALDERRPDHIRKQPNYYSTIKKI